jgi:AraC-like DNA-binding protein
VTWGDGAVHIGVGGGFPIPPVALAGPLPQAFANVFTGRVRGFFVRFAPAGPLALLGVEGRSYAASPHFEALVPAALAEAVRGWGDAVRAAPDFAARVALTERLLLGRLPHVGPRVAFAGQAAARIEATSGRMRVDALAAELGVGRSTLRRRFRADLGIRAKLFSEIVRFRHTHAYLHTRPEATWADALLRFGYADQSHLIRDYGRFAGVPPSRWNPDVRRFDLHFGIEEGPASG